MELAEQLAGHGGRPRYLVCAGGSCGTLSGLTLGLALAGSDAQVAGVSISNSVPEPGRAHARDHGRVLRAPRH
ncbi:MAG: D-cysteine desulfhydrase family protein, partial [Candidatus Dormibacteraeota bacterium]|nr:D-cysteine desulfhydrase family protein [Candidatus Dormibacteraeota bacterium]